MKDRFERVCGKLISQTFRVINPIKKKIINTDCEVHLFIQSNALDILKEETPLMKLGSPEDIAKCALFLASEGGDFLTGQVISPNGGFVI